MTRVSGLPVPSPQGVDLPKIILASASPRRSEILAWAGVDFEVHPSELDESAATACDAAATPDPALVCQSLALSKARAVAALRKEGLVLGADTLVVVDGLVLGKPRDAADARRMLGLLEGREHEVLTGVALVDAASGAAEVGFERTTVRFLPMTGSEIDWYVSTGEPMDKAGAYAIQGIGSRFVSGINGCFFNVMGLPVSRVLRMAARLSAEVRYRGGGSAGRGRGAGT